MILYLLISICSMGLVCAASESARALTVSDLLSRGDDIHVLYTGGEVTLDLASKGLTTLKGLSDVEGIGTVQRLRLTDNKLRSLTKSDLACMSSLKFLHVDHNELEFISSDTFFTHVELRGLNLMGNKLQDVTAILAVFNRLIHIDLTANQVISFEPTSVNPKLRYLSLARNEHDGHYPLHRNLYQCCPQLHPAMGKFGEYFCFD